MRMHGDEVDEKEVQEDAEAELESLADEDESLVDGEEDRAEILEVGAEVNEDVQGSEEIDGVDIPCVKIGNDQDKFTRETKDDPLQRVS